MSGPRADKSMLRRAVLDRRHEMSQHQQQRLAQRLCEQVLGLPEMRAASTVAAYRSLPGEPGTGPLLSALCDASVTVLLPDRQADNSLRWKPLTLSNGSPEAAPDHLQSLEEGDQRFRRVDVIVCPGVAGDLRGHRLGRGGGSYDRALADLAASVRRCLLLYDDEVLEAVPYEPHDQPVDVLVTPTRILRLHP